MTDRAPDFFIIGAPKCGTTSLYSYLRDHPQIFMPENKEPHYYASDFPTYRNIKEWPEYAALFRDAADLQLAGEASVFYLYSEVAVKQIVRANKDTKLIAMLRNPIDAVVSLHSQKLHSLDEDISDFFEAWCAQDERRRGKRIPPLCREPKMLLYKDVFSYESQLRRLLEAAPRPSLKIILFDDFQADPRKMYAEVLEFLGVRDDGRRNFDLVNPNTVRRGRWLLEQTVRLRRHKTGPIIKHAANMIGFRPGRFINSWSSVPSPRPCLSHGVKKILVNSFAEEIERLGQLLRRDLSGWHQGGG